ncbi:D-ribitol-5-phosphate cytidylyltransferase-like [Crassostrea virginica]
MNFPVYVVLPGSGVGLRFGNTLPKQYTDIKSKPLFLYTVNAFHRFAWVQMIVVVVSPCDVDWVQEQLERNNFSRVRVVAGEKTRHRSIYNGVKALKDVCRGDDVVLIHDIVRVVADKDAVKDVAKAAKLHGASGITRPLTSTVIARNSDGFLSESLDRTKYLASEMPQGFHFDVINTAYEKASEYDFEFGTECLHLAFKYTGTKARLVEGPDSLWKVTYRKDLFAAEGTLTEKLSSIFVEEGELHLKDIIVSCITDQNLKVSSEKSPNCTHSGFVFFIPHGNLESDISVKLKNICLLMNKLISDHSMEKSDLSINASTAKATSENASDLEMDNKVCPKCSFLANKMVIMVIEIDRKERSRKMEIIRDLILDKKLPNCVYVSVIVCHSDSCLNKVGSLTASVLRNQDLGLNQQVLYVG